MARKGAAVATPKAKKGTKAAADTPVWNLKKDRWPKMKLTGTEFWGGGRVRHDANKRSFRVNVYRSDDSDKAFGYGVNGKRKEMLEAWERGIQAIVTDKRPRGP